MEPQNIDTFDKIFMYFDQLTDYKDFSETKEFENTFWKYVNDDILKNMDHSKILEFENNFRDVTYVREKQGFINGFNYALSILGIEQLKDNM